MENEANLDEPLIQNCPACGAAMDVTEVEPLSAVVCPSCGAPTTVGSMIDHFQLVDTLGQGGMGAVYKAHDTSLDRMVALKLLRRSSGSAGQIKQLETEAAITASINHPHVVRVFSTGTDRGRFYIAMELVEKGTLDRLIELQGSVAEAQVLQVGIQIASGLRAAQQAGLIHRDVKPGNILFTDAHTAKIVDFGLAIFAEDEAKVRGEIWGTPYYVAPEKLDQKPEDFRSDIYSLGATLFHALAGRPPFEAENASLVALKHLKSQAVSLQAFAPFVSTNTAYVINRTLNKDPDQRYQSYDELIEHLEYALSELQAGRGKAGEKRLVLETAGQKKVLGALTFVMIGIIVVLIGAGVFFRKAMFHGSKSAVETGQTGALIDDGLAALVGGRTADAMAAFAGVAAQKPEQPLLNWADMLTGLTQFSDGHRSEGFETFRRIEARGPYSKKETELAMANFFVDTAQQMTSEHLLDPGTAKPTPAIGFPAAANLFFGMKDWQSGDVDEGAEFLRRFRAAQFTGPDSWLEKLKPLATSMLEEYAAFHMAADAWKAAKTIEQKRAALKGLRGVQGKLAPKAKEMADSGDDDVTRAVRERNQMIKQGRIPEGRYRLVNRRSAMVVEVEGHAHDDGHKLQTGSQGPAKSQHWQITPLDGGYYLLVGSESNKAMSVPKASTADGVALEQANVNRSPSQRWKIEKVGPMFFKLTAQCSGKALAVAADGVGAAVIQTTYTNAPEQQWKIEGM